MTVSYGTMLTLWNIYSQNASCSRPGRPKLISIHCACCTYYYQYTTAKPRDRRPMIVCPVPLAIGIVRIKNWWWPKMEEWSEWPIKHFWFYLYGLKSREIMYLKCLHVRNCLLYYAVYTGRRMCSYYEVKSLCCSGGKLVSNCISARVSDRWICSIIRHSRRFSIEALSAV